MENALEEYKRIASLIFPRISDGDIYAKSFYMIGKIYDGMGKKAETVEHYGRFLELWKDADRGIPEVNETRRRLEAI